MVDEDQESPETYSPERNKDGTLNEARERALEDNARRVYDEDRE